MYSEVLLVKVFSNKSYTANDQVFRLEVLLQRRAFKSSTISDTQHRVLIRTDLSNILVKYQAILMVQNLDIIQLLCHT